MEENEMLVKWQALEKQLTEQFGKRPDLNAILFLIGIRELGLGVKKYSKQEKVDLMHIATCRLLSQSGYYELVGKDSNGWPHWELVKKVPFVDIFQQETLLRQHILEYFENL